MSVTRQAPPLVPSWLDHLAAVGWRVLVTVALGVALLAIALRLGTTVASLMVAIIVAATLAPFAVRMHARGWSSLKAAGALTGALVLGVLAVVVIVILVLVPVVTDVGTSISDAVTRLEAILVALPFGDAIQKFLDVLIGLARNVIGGEVATIAGSVATIATIAMFVTFITF